MPPDFAQMKHLTKKEKKELRSKFLLEKQKCSCCKSRGIGESKALELVNDFIAEKKAMGEGDAAASSSNEVYLSLPVYVTVAALAMALLQ